MNFFSSFIGNIAIVILCLRNTVDASWSWMEPGPEETIDGPICRWRGVECIPYQVVESAGNALETDFEERIYPETKWVSVRTRAASLYDAKRIVFRKLVYYIQGLNSQNLTIDLTTPVRTLVTRGGKDGVYTMSFPIPQSLFDDTPIPNDSNLFIETEPPRAYLVRRFTGKPSEEQWAQEAEKLFKSAAKDGRVITDRYYTARYDLIFFITERRNEIWIPLRVDISPF